MNRFIHRALKHLILLSVLLFPFVAGAHATPVTYTPESSATVLSTPEDIVIVFSERIEPESSAITVFGPDGNEAGTDRAYVEEGNARAYGVAITDKGEGVYTVSWQVVSADDGHFTKGAFAFLVDAEGAEFYGTTGQVQIQHVTTLPEAGFSLINLLGQSMLVGALVLLVFGWKWLIRHKEITVSAKNREVFERRLTRFVLLGIFFTVLGTASFIVIKTFDLQQLRGIDFFATLQLFLASNAGTYALYRLGLSVAFLGVFFGVRKRLFTSEGLGKEAVVLFVILGLIMLAQSRVSHAAASLFLPNLSILATALHLFFKELLVGGVAALLYVVLPALSSDIRPVLLSYMRYSRMALIAVAVAGVTGVYIIWLHLKEVSNLFDTEWGGRFTLLMLFGAGLFLLRLLHTFVLEPLSLRRFSVLSWLPVTYTLEFLAGVAVLFFSGYISITTPPLTVEEYAFEKREVSQGVEITLSPHTYESDKFLISLKDDDGVAFDPQNIIVSLENRARGIGPVVVPVQERFEGGYVFKQNALSPPGDWDVRVVVQPEDGYDAVAHFAFAYPQDLEETLINQEERHADTFSALSIVLSLGIILLSVIGLLLNSLFMRQALGRSGVSGRLESISLKLKYGLSVLLFGGMGIVVWMLYGGLFVTDFERICKKDGHFWLQSASMRNGETISPNTTTGCTLSVGLFHFTSREEYEFFFKGVETLRTTSDLVTIPERPQAGEETALEVMLRRVDDNNDIVPLGDLVIEHDRKVHVLIIGEDLETFAHIHPDDKTPITPEVEESGVYRLEHTFPEAGRYTVLVDYVVQGRELQERFFVDVEGSNRLKTFAENLDTKKEFDGYTVELIRPEVIREDKEVVMTYVISKDGEPLRDLEPYLAASMHLGIIRSDLNRPTHTHGEIYVPGSAVFQQLLSGYVEYHSHFVPSRFGPKIQARMTFPTAGLYTIFGEFKHDGKVVVTNFTVPVEEK